MAAKKINQETFDNVVKENMEEFEMDAEEALEDAVSQFEAQGINLSNIVRDASLYSSNGESATTKKHPIIEAMEMLEKHLSAEQSLDIPQIKAELQILKAECDKDLARRCLVGEKGAFCVLTTCCRKFESDPEVFKLTMEALCSLCNGQPDLMSQDAVSYFCNILKSNTNEETLVLVVRLIRLNCLKHETNRQYFVAEDLISILVNVLDTHKDNHALVKETCMTLRTLTLDDDVRVPFGKGHEHAKTIVTEENALRKIMAICTEYKNDKIVLSELFSTLGALAVRNEFCQEIMDLGGLQLILVALENNMEHLIITRQALRVLKAIAGNDEVKKAIVKHNGVELILAAMAKHQMNAGITEAGCAVITTVVLRQPAHCQRVMDAGGAEILTKAIQLHPSEVMVQKQGSMAIRNLVARTPEHGPPFINLGVEELLNQALMMYKDELNDETRSALRDLGCQVELKCLWMGEGKGVKS